MPKLIRPTYPVQFSIALLALIFIISSLLSYQIFTVPFHDLNENKSVYLGMFLVGAAVVIMLLILWEEFLFPIKVKQISGGMIFRNHRTKLKTQLLIYCSIPAIFIFIFLNYEINFFRFIICAAICVIAPLVEKIASGLNNYNDYLKLTNERIEYKDNEKEGSFEVKDILKIEIVKDDGRAVKNLQLLLKSGHRIIINLDKMELDAFYDTIHLFIAARYRDILEEKGNGDTD